MQPTPALPLTHLIQISERTTKLDEITRYSLYTTMYYRGSILDHTYRVAALALELSPYAKRVFGWQFDIDKTLMLALVHDDPEIIIGDIQAGNRSKMSDSETANIEQSELAAINFLAEKFPNEVRGYSYKELLLEAHHRQSIESQFIQYVDKLDAFGEALHEIYAGNTCFVTNVTNTYGTIPTPTEYYIDYFEKYLDKFPNMQPLFASDFPIELIPEKIEFKSITEKLTPHTIDSFILPSGYAHYDFWKQTIQKHSGTINIPRLCTQTEFPQPPSSK